jgi:ribosomal protein S12 methylthiotransferase accessory factor
MHRPRFRADHLPIRVTDDRGDHLLVVAETRHLLIDDPLAGPVAELLDGSRDVAAVLGELGGTHSPLAIATALRRLAGHGLLAEGAPAAGTAAVAAWDARQVDPDRAQEWLATGHLVLVDAGSPGVGQVADTVRLLGPEVTTIDIDRFEPGAHPPGTPVVVAPRAVTDPRLARLNNAFLAAGRSWTMIRPHGHVVLFGPHFVPGDTGCWQCLRQRWDDNDQVANFLAGRCPDDPRLDAALAALPATATALAGLLAAELPVLAERGRSERITGRMVALDTRDLTTTTHELVRQPQCPRCGDPTRVPQSGTGIDLTAGPLRGGSARVTTPRDTYGRIAHEVSRYLGVVTRLVSTTGDDDLLHGFRAAHHFPTGRQAGSLRQNLRGYSGGKGRTEIQARVGAIAEAVERYCAVWRGDRPTSRSSYRRLGPDRAVHPRDLLNYSDKQYANRTSLNATLGHFHHVPRPMDDDLELDWTTGWSLTRAEPRDVPAAYCWYGHPELAALETCAADSNGGAAGNTVAEAVLEGFCELVERDSVALWWYHRSRMPGVDLDSVADPWLDSARDHLSARLGRDLWVLDITADTGIPAFAAVSPRLGDTGEDVLVGFGAHLDPRIALDRAVIELCQFLPLVTRTADGRTRYGIDGPDAAHWFSEVRVGEQPWLRPDPGSRKSTMDTHRNLSTGDVAADVDNCVRLAAAAGLETIVVDQSRPDLALSVVKVIVPGLRHFWRRLGGGRLWDVPVRLGRTPRAIDEDSVNPFNVFF